MKLTYSGSLLNEVSWDHGPIKPKMCLDTMKQHVQEIINTQRRKISRLGPWSQI